MASEAFCEQMLRVQTAMNLKWFWQPHSALTGGIEGPPLFFFFFATIFLCLDFSHGKFGLLSSGKASCNRVMLPNQLCMLGALVFP